MMMFLALAGAAITLFVLDRALLRAEASGWIYYRKRRANPGTAAGAALEMQALLEPDKRHALELIRVQSPDTETQEE